MKGVALALALSITGHWAFEGTPSGVLFIHFDEAAVPADQALPMPVLHPGITLWLPVRVLDAHAAALAVMPLGDEMTCQYRPAGRVERCTIGSTDLVEFLLTNGLADR